LIAFARALILAALFASGATQRDEKPSYSSARHGFRVTAPASSWKIDELPDSKPGVFALLLRASTNG